MKKLTLLIGDKEQTFTIPFVSGMVWRKYIELKAKIEDKTAELTVEQLDEFASLVVLAYKDKFTLEQFYEGIPYDKVMSTIDGLFAPTDSSEGDLGNEKK